MMLRVGLQVHVGGEGLGSIDLEELSRDLEPILGLADLELLVQVEREGVDRDSNATPTD